jgi:hypothetical protein
MKPPVLYPTVDPFTVHPGDYEEWERLCEAVARHCREEEFKVAGWEVCNEPDMGEMGGTPHWCKSALPAKQTTGLVSAFSGRQEMAVGRLCYNCRTHTPFGGIGAVSISRQENGCNS